MKASSVFRSPLFVKGADIGTTKTMAEADLNKCHQVTAGVVVTIPTPLTMKAQAGDMVMLFNSSAAGASVALGAGASFLNHSGSVPLTPGVAVLLVAYSDNAWAIQGIVPATQADIVAGTDVKKFINPKEHLSFHQADITKLAGIATGANLYVHPNHSGDVTSVADGAQTIVANAVTNTKLADMANATIKGRVTAGAGDPEDLTATQVRTILNVANGAQKNSDILKSEIEEKLTGEISSHMHATAPTPTASDTVAGIVELSTTAEAEAGTDTTRAVTPAGVAAAIAAAVAWLESGDYVAGSTPLVAIMGERQTEMSSFGNILPAGYPGSQAPAVAIGQAGFVSNDVFKEAYFFVADKPGEVTLSVDVKKGSVSAVIRWCKNGAALESEITHSSTTYGTYTKTVSFNDGDCVSVQVRDTSSSGYAYCKDFKVLIG